MAPNNSEAIRSRGIEAAVHADEAREARCDRRCDGASNSLFAGSVSHVMRTVAVTME